MIFFFFLCVIHISFGQRQHGSCTCCLSSHYFSVKRGHRSTPHLKSALQPQNHVKFFSVTEFNSVKCVIIFQRPQGMCLKQQFTTQSFHVIWTQFLG